MVWEATPVGQLIYGPGTVYDMDDRTLAHVKLALVAKMRRQESFLMSWPVSVDRGSGRVSLWVSSMIPLQFQFAGGRQPAINRAWVVAMLESAHSDRGLIVMTEAEAMQHAPYLRGQKSEADQATL